MPSKKPNRWIARVQATSFALALPSGIFTRSAKAIARELQQAALASHARKGTPFQSAMSMLNYYINRAGKKLSTKDKGRLEQAKMELRILFGKPRKKPSS